MSDDEKERAARLKRIRRGCERENLRATRLPDGGWVVSRDVLQFDNDADILEWLDGRSKHGKLPGKCYP